jgi:hypothetical protein
MSRGLGKVERQILEAFARQGRTYAEMRSLIYVVAGVMTDLGEDPPNKSRPTCRHRETISYEGGEYIKEIGHNYWPCPVPGTNLCYAMCTVPVGWINQTKVVVPPAHDASCYPSWREPSPACQRSVARAVRSLERRGLLKGDIRGYNDGGRDSHPHRWKTVWLPDAWAVEQQQRAERRRQAGFAIAKAMAGIRALHG